MERQVLSAATSLSGAAIKQAMMQSLKGQALAVTTALPPDITWEKLLQALKIKYQEKAPYDVLMAQFWELGWNHMKNVLPLVLDWNRN